jgi:hypothetical protein
MLIPPHRLFGAPLLVLLGAGVVVVVLDASFVLVVLLAADIVVAVLDAYEDEAASMT